MIMKMQRCRFCDTELKQVFVDLGMSPLANSFLSLDMLDRKENFYPLRVFVCNHCLLVQLEEFESAEKIFTDYAYFSSYSDTWLTHAENYVNMIISRFNFNNKNQIVEIASNDGYLLQFFKKKGIPILGIEPAKNVAKVAEEKGIPTITKFFGTKTAEELVSTGKQASLLLGNNVLAHVPNLNDFVLGMKILLKPEGIITMEFPHLLKLIQQIQFDTIYHEHFSYFSLFVVQKIFSRHDLVIFDVDELPTHGGSLRIYAKHVENNTLEVGENVNKVLKKEEVFGLVDISLYENFQKKVDTVKQDVCYFVTKSKKENKKIVCYGAPAKGNTLLNFCNIGTTFIDYTVDRNPHKQGLYLPGTHIPIKSPEKILETKPDYLIILPWNLKEEIMSQMSYIRNWNGKFVVLIPEVKIYS
jgi:2-polyprenyl-3-methyl-5-hydroxy-6-metoxy-1,4-benzoquinol methylase